MTCADAEPLLAAAADGALDDPRRARLDAHLAACASCRAALDDQRQVAAILASAVLDEVSPAFLARVNNRIDGADDWLEIVDFRAWTLRLAPIAATLALIAVLGIGARASSSSSSSSSSSPATATTTASTFSPSNAADWDRDVPPNALLEAALRRTGGDADAR